MILRTLLKSFRRRVADLDLCVDSRAGLDQLLKSAHSSGRFHVPTALCTSRGAFSFGGWHPFVAELLAPGALRAFYAAFQPRSLAELHFLSADFRGAELSPRLIPWYENEFGDYSDAPLKPSAFYGPASPEILASKQKRLHAVRQSIEREGYQPDRYGDIRGYFLSRGDEVRFFVHGGRHRAACLAASGGSIPARLRDGVPPVVDVLDIERWPFVFRGQIERSGVEAIFNRFFDWSGVEQTERLSIDFSYRKPFPGAASPSHPSVQNRS